MATATKHINKILPKLQTAWQRSGLLVVALMLIAGMTFTAFPASTSAETVQEQIDRLNNENNSNKQAIRDLSAQAVNYQDAIRRAKGQISYLQAQINNNQIKQADLQAKILVRQAELGRQRASLSDSIKSIYVKGSISSLEMLATSKTLSDFIDAETYRTAVQLKIQHTLEDINRIQDILNAQKLAVDQLIADLQTQQQTLLNTQNEQARLLAYNAQQQSEYNTRVAANQNKINSLIASQARLNDDIDPSSFYFIRFPGQAKAFDGAAYPYKNAGFGMSFTAGCVDNDGPDKWGYCTRQCVSYAAWAVEASGRAAPTFYGNARDWVSAARRDGVSVTTSNPKPGDIAISTAGSWGHAMYVEQVEGNRMFVSQYNVQLQGEYSSQWRAFR